jgi:hypothetical protein
VSLLNTVGPSSQTSSAGDKISLDGDVGFFANEARARLLQAGAMINNVVTTRPAVALGAALAAGVVVGWLVKRR